MTSRQPVQGRADLTFDLHCLHCHEGHTLSGFCNCVEYRQGRLPDVVQLVANGDLSPRSGAIILELRREAKEKESEKIMVWILLTCIVTAAICCLVLI
jgi:hypothetical protein